MKVKSLPHPPVPSSSGGEKPPFNRQAAIKCPILPSMPKRTSTCRCHYLFKLQGWSNPPMCQVALGLPAHPLSALRAPNKMYWIEPFALSHRTSLKSGIEQSTWRPTNCLTVVVIHMMLHCRTWSDQTCITWNNLGCLFYYPGEDSLGSLTRWQSRHCHSSVVNHQAGMERPQGFPDSSQLVLQMSEEDSLLSQGVCKMLGTSLILWFHPIWQDLLIEVPKMDTDADLYKRDDLYSWQQNTGETCACKTPFKHDTA